MRWLTVLWGLGGVLLMLVRAISRLAPHAVDALGMPLDPVHVLFAVVWVAFMAIAEGYRGFQQRFVPMAVARAFHLADHPHTLRLVLAPLFCMGFFHGTARRLHVTWGLTLMIVALVALLRVTPQPWRGLVDLGVVVGLSWGAVAIVVQAAHAWRAGAPGDPELPHGASLGRSPDAELK